MNAFQRSAVFAAVLVLLALHAEATVSQPTPTFQTCSFYNSWTSAAVAVNEQYNPWSQFCCATGIKSMVSGNAYQDPLALCCTDISTQNCPTASNTTCCRPATPWTDNDPDASVRAKQRDCYNPAYQGCCQATYVKDYNNGTTRNIATAAVYDSETQQCCAAPSSMPVPALVGGVAIDQHNAAQMTITPKGTPSCILQLRAAGVEFRCTADTDCPGQAAGRGKCCRQQMPFGGDAAEYAYKNWGRCYDPKYEDCCNSWVGRLNASQTTQVNATQIINTQFHQCCRLPVYNQNGADMGNQVYAIPVGQRCPCLQNSDCGGPGANANYTCCAPTQAQIQGGEFSSRRLVQCAVAGQATNQSDATFANSDYASRFPGCYGKCIPSGANPAATSVNAPVCLNSLPSLSSCANLRVENAAAFAGANPNLLTGSQWVTPSLSDLIQTESAWHGADCCKGNPEGEFSVLYWQSKSLCCPVMGIAPAEGALPRRLSPVVTRTAMSDTFYPSTAVPAGQPASWGGCLCNENSHCQTGFVCCQNGLSWLTSGYFAGDQSSPTSAQANKARQLIYSLNGTGLMGICVDPKTTECCDLKKSSPDTFNKGPLAISLVQPYLASGQVCCAESGTNGGLQANIGQCACHTDADCQNGGAAPWGACCSGNGKWGSETHSTGGMCYDTRRQSCCRYHSDLTDVPVQDGVVGLAKVYDNTTQVCCPYGGPQTTLANCKCRSDMESADCGTSAKCCAGVVSNLQTGTTYRSATGFCYDSSKNQSCCQSRATAIPANTVAGVYDNTKQVCCMVNGVQRDHRSCACSSDAHCPANGQCCTDGQSALAGARVDCSDFPSLTSNTPTACPGKCIFKELETCCDNPWTSEWKAGTAVSTCVKDYQKCCDGACCNKATETCKKTTRNWYSSNTAISKIADTGAHAQGSAVTLGLTGAFNPGYHYGLEETAHVCTKTEHSSPSIVFHTWVFPAFLSVASIIVVVLGSRAGFSADLDSSMQRIVLVGLQVFVAVMSILLLWSPLWKYGFGIIFANSFILHAFVVGGQWTRRFACILMVVTFLWVYEPFGSNSILNFGTITFAGRGSGNDGKNGYEIHGLNFAARMLQRPRDGTNFPDKDACVEFYQYWKTDPAIHDARTWNPEGKTRGICRRSWMHTIAVLAGIIMPFEAVWLFLVAIAFAKQSQHTKDVKVQPIQA